MSRLSRIGSAPFRLASAMRRQGVGPVLSFVVLTVRRRGMADALRLGVADPRHRETAEEEEELGTDAPVVRSTTMGDLGDTYGLSASAWALWAPLIGTTDPSGDPYEDHIADAKLEFVIQGDLVDAAALARTRQALAALGDERRPGRTAESHEDADRWTVFLRAGDAPDRNLPRALARAARGGVAEVVSFDMIRRDGDHVYPLLAPGSNPTLLRAVDYLFGRVAVRGAARAAAADVLTVDPRRLVLDWLDAQTPHQARGRWRHVGQPLVDARITAQDIDAERARALARNRSPAPWLAKSASVIICTRDKGHLTRQLVRSLLSRPPDEIGEVIIVANGTTNPYALATLEDLTKHPRVTVLRRDTAFNFSRLCNDGVRATRGDGPLLFLNDDITPVSEDWLARLAAPLERAEVGAVGPLLIYPDERVQHAGMYLGFNGRAGHTLRAARLPEEDYLFTAVAPREVSCVTGAVVMVRREAFEAVGGFDDMLATYLQDVDLGLRLRQSGWLNVFEPAAVLIHMESASIRDAERQTAFHRQRKAEDRHFLARWGTALTADPFHPRGFDLQDETLRTLVGPRGRRPAVPARNTISR